jgi:hypothetical protein
MARARAFLLAALCVAGLAGCRGLFTPAVPEPPIVVPFVPNYSAPLSTLTTMENAMRAKALGQTAWLDAFASDSTGPGTPAYHHFVDPVDEAAFAGSCGGCGVPTTWDRSREQAFFLYFLGVRPSDNYLMSFRSVPERPDPEAGEETVTLYREYLVVATSPDETSTLIIARGSADITFTRIAGSWVITVWSDHLDPDVGPFPVNPYELSLGRLRLEASR